MAGFMIGCLPITTRIKHNTHTEPTYATSPWPQYMVYNRTELSCTTGRDPISMDYIGIQGGWRPFVSTTVWETHNVFLS
jgi:hypothetical protein